jgi:hypothetical protein
LKQRTAPGSTDKSRVELEIASSPLRLVSLLHLYQSLEAEDRPREY